MKSSGLHIGTSGWSYQHWSGNFYPEEVKPAKYLEYYITHFDCVELNASFYHLPLKTTVTGWINRTPGMFRFCPKLSRFVTHQLKLVHTDEALQKFFGLFDVMQSRTGPVLIQLPPGLTFDKSLICNFLGLLKENYSRYRFAIEVRNKSWINDSFFDILAGYGIALVVADSGGRYPYNETTTTDFTYLRFHGREQLYASDYRDSDLAWFAEKIIQWIEEGKEVWAFFNNDYHGFAVKNAKRLLELTGQL